MEEKIITTNRKLFRDYHVLETIECGMELKGSEVKSLREQRSHLEEAFARVEGGQVYLYNCHITPYEKASYFKEEATRPRRLLLHRSQIKKLIGQMTMRGYSLVPMRMYFNKRGLVKVAVSLVKGKKMHDRRETIKKRESDRQLRRMVRNRQR